MTFTYRDKDIGKAITIFTCVTLLSLSAAFLATPASAYWIWTPETKKFINPKYAVKDTPKEQFDWAMSFYDSKDYKRAAVEFEKLAKHFEFSEYASRAQFYAGRSYDSMNKYYIAFQAYQKAIDNFPHTDNMDDIIQREFEIAQIYAEKKNPKVLGADIMTSNERAIEIYRKVVENAPFGKLADQAQFRMAEVMKRDGRYEEATLAFQKIIDDYPDSSFADKAQYEVAQCAYKASLQPAYDVGPTDRALKIFEDYASASKDEKLSKEALDTMKRLKDKAAEKSMMTARFYEGQRHPVSAIIYYQDVIDRFPESSSAPEAKAKIEALQAQSVRKSHSGGIFSWFSRPAPPAVEAAPVEAAPRKGWSPFGWFSKPSPAPSGVSAPAMPAPEPAIPKKGWSPFGWFSRPQAASGPATAMAPSAAAQPGVAMAGGVATPGGAMQAAAVSTPMQAVPCAAPIPRPERRGWDFFGLLGPKEEAAKKGPPDLIPDTDIPVPYDEKGVSGPQPTGDDPNVDTYDDRI
jgi:outer membrane assembly lipoprotein YfiO